jgi:hypothetical protein
MPQTIQALWPLLDVRLDPIAAVEGDMSSSDFHTAYPYVNAQTQCLLSTSRRALLRRGFARTVFIPAAKQSASRSVPANAVTATIGTESESSRMYLVASIPSIFGIMTSMKTRSKDEPDRASKSSLNRCVASAPSAQRTTSKIHVSSRENTRQSSSHD